MSKNINIIMNKVESGNIEEIGYCEEAKLLRVNFKSGARYGYMEVPPEIWQALGVASSKGAFLARAIKDKFQCIKYEDKKDEISKDNA